MRKSRLSWYKQTRLIELFVAGCTVRTAPSLLAVNKTTASHSFHHLRLLIYKNNRRRKGKRGRGAGNKFPVFGLLKRNGSIYACTIPNARAGTLIPNMKEKVKPDSIVYTDYFRG